MLSYLKKKKTPLTKNFLLMKSHHLLMSESLWPLPYLTSVSSSFFLALAASSKSDETVALSSLPAPDSIFSILFSCSSLIRRSLHTHSNIENHIKQRVRGKAIIQVGQELCGIYCLKCTIKFNSYFTLYQSKFKLKIISTYWLTYCEITNMQR